MAKLAVTVAGGMIGGLIGGPLGAQIGMTLGGALGSSLFGPTTHGPRLDDLTITTSTYGNAIPEVYGTTRIAGNLIWSSGIKENKKKSGGKGGPKQVSYSYSASFAIAVCKGEIDDVLRIWADSKLIYGETPVSAVEASSGGFGEFIAAAFRTEGTNKKTKYKFRVYKGDEDQLPDSLIEADVGVGRAPGYRGMAYIVFEDLPLEDFGNRIPSLTFEVTRAIMQVAPKQRPTYASGSNPSTATFFPDWEANKLIRYSNNIAYVFNLSTMEEIGRHTTTLPTDQLSFSPDNGPIYAELGNFNSRKTVIYESNTFTKYHESGIYSSRVGADVVDFCSGTKPHYGAINHFGNCAVYSKGVRKDFRLGLTWRNDFQIYLFDQCVYFKSGVSSIRTYVQGYQREGKSDIILTRNGTTASIQVLTLGYGDQGRYNNAPGYYGICPGDTYGQGATFDSAQIGDSGILNLRPKGRDFTSTVSLYDPTDDTIFMLGKFKDNGKLGAFKYFVNEQQFKWIKEYEEAYPLPQSSMKYSRLQGGSFGWLGVPYSYSSRTYTIDLQTGEIEQHGGNLNADFTDSFVGYTNQHWDDKSKSVFSGDYTGLARYWFRETSDTVTVGSIVADVFSRTGVLQPSDFDTSEINDITVRGYTITRESSARDILGQLATMYLFDGVETDYKIKIKKRGSDKNVTINENWLGNVTDRDIQVKETRAQELELPMRVSLSYLEYGRDYQAGSQYSKRNVNPFPTMHSLREEKVEVPIVMDADEAKQFTDKALKAAWAGRSSYELLLPWKYLKYDPCDIAEVALDDGTVFRMRFNDMAIGADMNIRIDATSERAAAYVSNVQADGGSGVPVQYAANSEPAFPVVINTPLVRDLDDTQGRASVTYLSAYSLTSRFTGSRIYMSDNAEAWEPLAYIGADITTGFCINGLPQTRSYGGTDTTTALIVRLSDPSMELESITDDELLTGYKNAAVVGGTEIIQFRDAELLADGTYKLTNILRARRGTNYAVNFHLSASESFVMLDDQEVGKHERAPEDFEVTRYYRAVPPGELVEEQKMIGKDLLPVDLMPYSPEHVKVTDDGTTITITCVRRSRITSPLTAYSNAILNREGQAVPSATWEIWPNYVAGNHPFRGGGGDNLERYWMPYLSYTKTGVSDFPINGVSFDIATFQMPLTDIVNDTPGTEDVFILRVRENGYVPGIPKIVEARYVGPGRWNITPLY